MSAQIAPFPGVETTSMRVRRLQAEARAAAREDVAELMAVLTRLVVSCTAVADGGDVYPAGVRNEAKRLAEIVDQRAATIHAILERCQ